MLALASRPGHVFFMSYDIDTSIDPSGASPTANKDGASEGIDVGSDVVGTSAPSISSGIFCFE